MDSLLTTGNIPDLFDFDELDNLFMEIKNDAMIEGITEEKTELYKYLIKVCIYKIKDLILLFPLSLTQR